MYKLYRKNKLDIFGAQMLFFSQKKYIYDKKFLHGRFSQNNYANIFLHEKFHTLCMQFHNVLLVLN